MRNIIISLTIAVSLAGCTYGRTVTPVDDHTEKVCQKTVTATKALMLGVLAPLMADEECTVVEKGKVSS